ncbi:PEP-CTERM sorting domain-containing protein [Candidatus Colwellia aromaticivorans]|uniref:PEP-CTERM sorting domain-containing protein n=1 Tax=Candidatus Colwellia aromaticivorans TaxID=2267621 RepID=UPI001FEB121C|nr:PEP-CTERM sorting domain-containing protein [Candidatus Colwellia aromaticivorans]
MNFKGLIRILVAVFIFGSSFYANAGIITIGSLTLDQANDTYVKDSLNGLEWLRWDEVNTLNYSQLTTQLESGGTYDGWRIARNADANLFVDALFNGWHGDTCNSTSILEICWENSPSSGPISDFSMMMGNGYGTDTWNYAWFLSDNNLATEVGYIELYSSANDDAPTRVRKNNEWSTISNSDAFSATGSNAANSIGFMLVREAQDVPEPSTLAIFALGMIGLASRRFKKQS